MLRKWTTLALLMVAALVDGAQQHGTLGSVERLENRRRIADLLTRYSRAVDTKDWATYRSVFTPDAHIDYTAAGGIQGSVDEIVPWLARVFYWIGPSQHMVSNVEVELFEKGEVQRANVRAMFHNPNNLWCVPFWQPFFSVGGWYNHRLVRDAASGEWRSEKLWEEVAYNSAPYAFTAAAGMLLLLLWVVWTKLFVGGGGSHLKKA